MAAEVDCVVFQVPSEVRAGQTFRVVAMDSTEPPGPVGGVTVAIYRNGEKVMERQSSAFGEAVFQIDKPGDYEIKAVNAASKPVSVRILDQ